LQSVVSTYVNSFWITIITADVTTNNAADIRAKWSTYYETVVNTNWPTNCNANFMSICATGFVSVITAYLPSIFIADHSADRPPIS
jgi:hypothetical protein